MRTRCIHIGIAAALLLTPMLRGADQKSRITPRQIAFPPDLKQYEKHPWDLLRVREFKESYNSATKEEQVQHQWLKDLAGPSERAILIETGFERYVGMHSCKIHDCGENYVVILFNPRTHRCHGFLWSGEKMAWLGDPDATTRDTTATIVKVRMHDWWPKNTKVMK